MNFYFLWVFAGVQTSISERFDTAEARDAAATEFREGKSHKFADGYHYRFDHETDALALLDIDEKGVPTVMDY